MGPLASKGWQSEWMDRPAFMVICDTCAYRSEQPTRDPALDAALRHRGGANMGHRARIENPPAG